MSLIKVGFLVGGKLEVYCNRCRAVVGLFTSAEIGEMACAQVDVVCFDCEPGFADSVPHQLQYSDDYFLINIDLVEFVAGWCEVKKNSEVFALRYASVGLGTVDEAMGILQLLGGTSLSSGTYQHEKTGLDGAK